jgi:type IV fimbrial biogenesis protein FimT
MNARTLAGFTLLELMVTLAVLAILTAIAVPAFQTLFERNRLTSATNDLLGTLLMARSNAVTRRVATRVCPSTNASTCATGAVNWAGGWIVLEDPSQVIRVAPRLHASLAVTTGVQALVFDPAGNARDLVDATTIQLSNNSGQRCIRIRPNGQVTTERNACTS